MYFKKMYILISMPLLCLWPGFCKYDTSLYPCCVVSVFVILCMMVRLDKYFLFMSIQNHLSDSWLAALQLSVQEGSSDSTSQTDMSKLLADQSFVSSILASVCLHSFSFSPPFLSIVRN